MDARAPRRLSRGPIAPNGERGGPATRLNEDDLIDVLPAISGGCMR
jgi:hypothetical protein